MKPSAEAVLDLLRERPGGVTSLDALKAGCGSRLAGRVHELRGEGHVIRSEWETTDKGARVARYRLVEPVKPVQLAFLDFPATASLVPPLGRSGDQAPRDATAARR